MAVDGVIFDISETLIAGATGQAQPGVVSAIARLRAAGVQVIAAGNHPRGQLLEQLRRAGLQVDHLVSHDDVRANKGSPEWIRFVTRVTALAPNQLFYVGDTKYDMITAVQGSVIYAHASWATPRGGYGHYGLVAPSPSWVAAVVEHIFRRQHPWYWALDAQDQLARPIWVRALIDSNGAGDRLIRQGLLDVLKDGLGVMVGQMPLREFVMLHMLASLYTSGILYDVDYWTTYPGHTGGLNTPMGGPLDIFAKLFRQKYYPDLFERHTLALRSRAAFRQGDMMSSFMNQATTMKLNDGARSKLIGKSILVVDNYLTRGPTIEGARNLLLAAGANRAFLAVVSKYKPSSFDYAAFCPKKNAIWDPFAKTCPSTSEFTYKPLNGASEDKALASFAASYRAMLGEQW